jgi:PIN domain nuclease of toxin-antitoxin system
MRPHLLDTHVLLWFLGEPDRLSETTRSLIENRGNRMLVSAATAWEIAIKRALGRLDCPANLEEILADQHFESLSISIAHALEVASLPLHHGDPFDRMLVAQAKLEGATIVTTDARLAEYGVPIHTA